MKLMFNASNSLESKGNVDLKSIFISLDLVCHHKANGTKMAEHMWKRNPELFS